MVIEVGRHPLKDTAALTNNLIVIDFEAVIDFTFEESALS
jgi:hypothetical protein